jgi:hypothetical protein
MLVPPPPSPLPSGIAKASTGMSVIHQNATERMQKKTKKANRRGSIRDVEVDMETEVDTRAEDLGTKKGKLLKLPTKGNFYTHNTKKGAWKERFCSLDGYDGTL